MMTFNIQGDLCAMISKNLTSHLKKSIIMVCVISFSLTVQSCSTSPGRELEQAFMNPPSTSFPGVYWYFMDGNLSREGHDQRP